ncbi:MAG: hypothetical protein ACI9N0_000739 [Ilumatobacter sp.]|jgi:hypothetical protein
MYEHDNRLRCSRSTAGSKDAELIPLTAVFHPLSAEHFVECGRSASGRAMCEVRIASESHPSRNGVFQP